MPPRFLYFDLGKVILDFSVERMLAQMAEVSGISVEKAHTVVFEAGLQRLLESGRITTREFYDEYRAGTSASPDFDALCHASAAIFEVNAPMLPVVTHLRQAGYRLGILSNTCDIHWQYCLGRFRVLREDFSLFALSHEIGAMKPDRAVFEAAVAKTGVSAGDVFFTDDLAENVEGAQRAGLDAVHFVGTAELVEQLRARGVEFNY